MRISSPHLPFHPALVMDTGHGKLAAHVDLRVASGRETLREVVRGGDIFTQGYRPDTLAARGFSPEELAAIRPGIVYVSLCAYGRAGPWCNRRGFDTLVQNATGICDEQGKDRPRHLPVSPLLASCRPQLVSMPAVVLRALRAASLRPLPSSRVMLPR